jgi:hypothetical protein
MVLWSCSAPRVLIRTDSVSLRDGRFIGPLDIEAPRRADHQHHDFEIRAVFRSRCEPHLVLAFPDGETKPLGASGTRWQNLLERRAAGEGSVPQSTEAPAESVEAQPSAPPILERDEPPHETSAGQSATVVLEGQLSVTPPRAGGHWQSIATETWAGQLEFERERVKRCAQFAEYRVKYRNAFDATGKFTLWAEIPQELADASFSYEIFEIIEPENEPRLPVQRIEAVNPAPPARTTANPRPPQPDPRIEEPFPPEDRRARWVPGHWKWNDSVERWTWSAGWWNPPSPPPLKAEHPGKPPNIGCTWVPGHWEWESLHGRFDWVNGSWAAPPPVVEIPGAPPGPGAQWTAGRWSWTGARFEWHPGQWEKPPSLPESLGPQPFPGAQWIPGDWVRINGRWVWSAGFYEGDSRPPAPREEVPGVAPGPGAVWLSGHWRATDIKGKYEWLAGHWELPPGEGYVWVAEPQRPGLSLQGHWELQVELRPLGRSSSPWS